jgi:hypothetical protein
MFCPNQTTIRRGLAKQYDYALGLSGTPGAFTPTFQAVNVKTGGSTPPFTVDSSQKVTNLNADSLDGIDSSGLIQGGGRVTGFSTNTNCCDTLAQFYADPSGWLKLFYNCPGDPGAEHDLAVGNSASVDADLIVLNNSAAPAYQRIAAGATSAPISVDITQAFVRIRMAWDGGAVGTADLFLGDGVNLGGVHNGLCFADGHVTVTTSSVGASAPTATAARSRR